MPIEESAGAEVEDESATAFDGLAARQTRKQLEASIVRLPFERRECIHLVFFEELSLAEIAEIHGVPENSVKSELLHARRKLKILVSRLVDCANDPL